MQHTDARTQPVTAEQLQRLDELMLMLATGFIGLPVERIDDAIDDGLQLAGLAGRLVTGWRTDLETIVEANRMSYADQQDMVGRQMAHLKERIGEMQAVAKVMSVIGPKDSVRYLDDLALASVEMALADVRELAEAAAKSRREAFDLVHRRVNANIEEVQRLLRKQRRDDR